MPTRHLEVIDRTYLNNHNSDYTEQIESLGRNFNYGENKNDYWSKPEFSTLYGTPLYDEASIAQKIALNHLYWVGQYNHTANSEANTILYNQITSGVFANIGGYETLCKELDFETFQERYHIRTFQKIGYKTKVALLGKAALGNPLYKKSENIVNNNWLAALKSKSELENFTKKCNSSWKIFQEYSLGLITDLMLKNKADYYSQYLQTNKCLPTTAGGLAGVAFPGSIMKFFALNWGSSPFLASQYYTVRMIANMSLKVYEHPYFKYFKTLKKNDEFIPTPTAVSHYHLLDEAFHTTMSQVIAQDIYKDFPKPTAYEKLVANITIYLSQKAVLGGLSAGLPAVFRSDASFLLSFYRLLKSPLFNMSSKDSFYWMEKCLCQEHEGLHHNLNYHQNLLSDFRRFFEPLTYLWPINRELGLMASGGSIERTIKTNIKDFQDFSRYVDK